MRFLLYFFLLCVALSNVACRSGFDQPDGGQARDAVDAQQPPTLLDSGVLDQRGADAGRVVLTVDVAPLYPNNGRNFNDYIANDGPDRFSATDQSCPGISGLDACLHGAELKMIATPATSCADLVATDALGAFDWTCQVHANQAVFFSRGLKKGKGLKDLINAYGWLENHIEIADSQGLWARSIPSFWWNNPFCTAPANPSASDSHVVLDQSYPQGCIFVIDQSSDSSGYRISADKLSIVLLDSVSLRYSGRLQANCSDLSSTSLNARCMISVSGARYTWVEGRFDGRGLGARADYGILLEKQADVFNRIQASWVHHNEKNGILLQANSCILRSVQVSNNGHTGLLTSGYGIKHADIIGFDSFANGGDGLYFISMGGARVQGARLANNDGIGLINNSAGNTFVDIAAYNNGNSGIVLSGGAGPNPNVTLVGVLTANNAERGLSASASQSTVHGLSAFNNGTGIYTRASQGCFNQLLTTNNGAGLQLMGASFSALSNLAIGDNLYSLSSSEITYTGELQIFSGQDCQIIRGTNPGLVDASCANQGASTAQLRLGFTPQASFIGKIFVDDPVNLSDFDGQNFGSNIAQSIQDWSAFSTWFRSWGKDGGDFPSPDQQGRCLDQACRVWDWTLNAQDRQIRQTSGPAQLENSAFISGQICPAAVHGDQALTDQHSTPNVFLKNAFEIMQDDIGDDDGLCESGEDCIYMPNFGVYQGEQNGSLQAPCVFENGLVSGVRIYAWSANGL